MCKKTRDALCREKGRGRAGSPVVRRCAGSHLPSTSCVQQVGTNRMNHGTRFVSRARLSRFFLSLKKSLD